MGCVADWRETPDHFTLTVVATPIHAAAEVLREFGAAGRQGLVFDIGSLKSPIEGALRELAAQGARVTSVHPMFGPDSAADSLKGRKIVLCPERVDGKRYRGIKAYLEGKGLDTIETTPDEHDRQISVSLALTHFIGRSLSAFGAKPLRIDTEGYQRLLHVLEVVENDTWQLFVDMHRYNPYARRHREEMVAAMSRVDRKLEESMEERHA